MNGLIIGELEDFETIKKEILDVFPGEYISLMWEKQISVSIYSGSSLKFRCSDEFLFL